MVSNGDKREIRRRAFLTKLIQVATDTRRAGESNFGWWVIVNLGLVEKLGQVTGKAKKGAIGWCDLHRRHC